MPSRIAEKVFHVTLWAMFRFCVDLLVGGRFLELNSEVDHGDIKGRNAQSHADELAVLEWHVVNKPPYFSCGTCTARARPLVVQAAQDTHLILVL